MFCIDHIGNVRKRIGILASVSGALYADTGRKNLFLGAGLGPIQETGVAIYYPARTGVGEGAKCFIVADTAVEHF